MLIVLYTTFSVSASSKLKELSHDGWFPRLPRLQHIRRALLVLGTRKARHGCVDVTQVLHVSNVFNIALVFNDISDYDDLFSASPASSKPPTSLTSAAPPTSHAFPV